MVETEGLEQVETHKMIQVKVYGFFPINIADETDPAVAKGRAKQFVLDSILDQRTGKSTFVIEKVEVAEVKG